MFQIETGVPVPERAVRKSKYPFPQMEEGDSFFVPGKTAAGMYASCRRASEVHGYKFIARTVVEDGEEGARVWCIDVEE